ncbi:MAG: late competence development ComFB family protein, partial [Gemmatimonadota bacterium]|nr:late competence development ComFB family protein [Gemmatimonadota bacterium]
MKNLVEQVVREIHAQLLAKHAAYCSCPQCADDVAYLVLNHLRPRYANTPRGWALAELELRSDQGRAELAVRVLDAMKRVAADPRHESPPGGRPSG